jgi:GGDEF domain-containing protein
VKRWMLLARRFFLLGALFFGLSTAQAAPQVDWGDMLQRLQGQPAGAKLEIDLRERWERTLVGSVEEPNEQPIDPALIWAWPTERFSSKPDLQPFKLHSGERMVARWTVFNEKLASDFLLTVKMPRIDVVHVSYRHDFGGWTTLTAGDRIPINNWSLADRQPSFNLPLPPGQMDVVVQFAHRGVVDAPMYLQNHRAFLQARMANVLPVGIFVGINLVMALMGVLLAMNFQKTGFLSVAVMSFVVSMVLLFGSGLGGLLVGTQSPQFNDEAKMLINMSWPVLLPCIAAMALSIHLYSRGWWWSMVALSCIAAVVSMVWIDYSLRDQAPLVAGTILVCSLSFVLLMIGWAWFRGYSQNTSVALGLLMYTCALVMLFTAYMGLWSVERSSWAMATMCMLGSFLLMRGLFFQHRMGRQVLARANTSPLRDVLTGLLNRDGMQAHLYRARERMREEQICALFIYMPVLDANTALEELGEQGFESGMVQMAASLTTSVSATDGVARISRHAFGISVLMQPDSATATRLAQKILTRVMALAASGTPLCATARLGMAWLPLNSFRIDGLEQRCLEALETLETGKRIAWVGGAQSYKEAEQMMRAMSTNPSDPPVVPAANAYASTTGAESNLYDRIHRIEREMLGVDTRFLEEEADRMSRALNEARDAQERDKAALAAQGKPDDFEPTVQQLTPQKPWPG